MEYHVNRGKICRKEGCNNKARVKGYCIHCYKLNRIYLKAEITKKDLEE